MQGTLELRVVQKNGMRGGTDNIHCSFHCIGFLASQSRETLLQHGATNDAQHTWADIHRRLFETIDSQRHWLNRIGLLDGKLVKHWS